ncbi:MAG: Hydroxyacylglutathione hydrolase [Chloroflexi bacterium]|nr:Hydroxyacylglutathione hydrolase [Chloroflexota bacterium]
MTIHTIDLNFQNIPNSIAAYLVPHRNGGVLVECGPGSTLPALKDALATHGLTSGDVTDVLVSHIHLDHAGSAGWWARQGARIHVHDFGAQHMIDPSRLLKSAARIYGDEMDSLWGEYLPVPEEQINRLHDNDVIEIEDLVFHVYDMPGHARHHMVYHFGDVCFTGDVGGIRVPVPSEHLHVRVPAVPPEFHLESWRESMERLSQVDFRRVAPTHFGIYDDAKEHIEAVMQGLDDLEAWMEAVFPLDPSPEEAREKFQTWLEAQARKDGLDKEFVAAYEAAIPTFMTADGIGRYWRKFRS